MSVLAIVGIVVGAVVLVLALSAVRIVREYQRIVVFRLGRLRGARGPGLVARAAEGEFQASERLSQAAGVIGRGPGALTLRTLPTLAEIASEHNSTLVLPIPIDVLEVVRRHAGMAETSSNGR